MLAESSGQTNTVPLETTASATDHKHLGHRRLLLLLQQQSHQRQGQLVFPRHATALTRQHRLVCKRSPTAGAFHPPQQRRVRFQGFSAGPFTLQSQADNAIRPRSAGRLTPARLLWQKRYEATLLIIQ